MPDIMSSLRAFARGNIDSELLESSMVDSDAQVEELENDQEFMDELMQECIGTILSMEILGEAADRIDAAIQEACDKTTEYLIAQGVLSEAAGAKTVNYNDKKRSFMRLSLSDRLNWLRSMAVLTIARRKGDSAYKKFKLGQRIKKENMAKMVKKFGAAADKLAKKMIKKFKQPNGRVTTIISDAKTKAGTKKAA